MTKVYLGDVGQLERLIAECLDPRENESKWWRIDCEALRFERLTEQ